MDRTHWSIEGLEIRLDTQIQVGSLRYLSAGALASRLASVPGGVLPRPLQALCVADGAVNEVLLAWRSPTETLILSADRPPLDLLASALAGASEACLVDQTGGIWAVRLCGPRVEDLLVRIGAGAAVPMPGQALVGRFAELAVVALSPRQSEYALLVDRVYAEHLLGWINATVGDF